LILYHTDLRGQWPRAAADALAARLPYVRRLTARSAQPQARASLAGVALALRALARLLGRSVAVAELVFARGAKPRLASCGAVSAATRADFSISHSGPWVGCAASAQARVGFDVEVGSDARIADWVVREAALKASGEGLAALGALRELMLDGSTLHWRGACWHVQRVDAFPGACACLIASVAPCTLEVRALTLAELFGA
jgi:phosphopantetheinyl transferase